ncbi:MAG: hypothetical protein OXH36_01485 [Bdellovibrionales bacterium]|nr:hypothetical protein [Bdellovibrionales bacterium]
MTSIKTLILSAIMLFLGSFFMFQSLLSQKENKNRGPASYTLYTPGIEARSKKMMEESRRLHVIEDYKSANVTLSKLLDQYPYTSYREEASFLLAKGLFYEEEYGRSEQVIQHLREHDPGTNSKWLGYTLLVQGKIHEIRGEVDDSIRLYRYVIKEFSDRDLVNEAEDILIEVSP